MSNFLSGKGIKKELFLEDSFERFFVDEKHLIGEDTFWLAGKPTKDKKRNYFWKIVLNGFLLMKKIWLVGHVLVGGYTNQGQNNLGF